MSATTRLTRLALASAIALAATQVHASVRLSEAFDGAWFDPAASGRGVLIDFIPNAQRAGGTLFAADFVYDNAGNPFWITAQQNWSEFQYTSATVPLFRSAAGTWPAPGTSANTQIGTATFTINSCNSITVSYTMDSGSGFANRTQTLQRLGGVDSATCAYQQAFTACPSWANGGSRRQPALTYPARACVLPETITGDRTLTNDVTWVLEGKVQVGTDVGQGGTAATLRIQPGTLIVSSGQSNNAFDHLAVNRGSKIFAEGSRDFPIIMTSGNELPGSPAAPLAGELGGLVISGNAPSNCNPNCVAEWDSTNRHGGTNPEDNSGVVRYMQVRYAGYEFVVGRELNSFTFNSVGSGTTLEYLQAFRGKDDGFEWFGGTANVRYAVVTCPGDDGFDWDEGFNGKLQFGVVDQRGCAGEDHGFELSNSPTNVDSSPRARGTVANVTLLAGSGANRDAIQLNSGTAGNFYGILAQGFKRSCLAIEGVATSTAAGPVNNLTGLLSINNLKVFGCPALPATFRTGSGLPTNYTTDFFAAQQGNEILGASALKAGSFLPNGRAPTASFPLYSATAPGVTDWFVNTDYVGAFASDADADNWTLGWARPFNP
ncbi:hypothetical protein [Silanimonas sp.]|jgi:hypothetical protein|uniref:hypothetical protein n=1 Tax=Silanimonas sp. TaxID=1929290 RepID=UPI0022BE7B6A|nr:hypothetical protein [Silanimonas sp.]MCZ8114708.1 hypothetical protein [Silanimonas sp.]